VKTFIEYYNHDLLVTHWVRKGGKRTLCGERLKKMLVARPRDLDRAARGRMTDSRCLDCINA
jgi:hypothetical protein